MTIAKYENGVFRPLEEVNIKEGTVVEVLVPEEQQRHVSGPPSKIFPSTASGRTERISARDSNT
jgi:predicted DNA-binding antitoxin AbrB/MazE fold protein